MVKSQKLIPRNLRFLELSIAKISSEKICARKVIFEVIFEEIIDLVTKKQTDKRQTDRQTKDKTGLSLKLTWVRANNRLSYKETDRSSRQKTRPGYL